MDDSIFDVTGYQPALYKPRHDVPDVNNYHYSCLFPIIPSSNTAIMSDQNEESFVPQSEENVEYSNVDAAKEDKAAADSEATGTVSKGASLLHSPG